MKITVIGTGYVGLVTGTCFAETGNNVACVDIDENKIARLKKGEIPFYEPGLAELVVRNQKDGRLKFSTQLEHEIPGSEIVFICVGTPSKKDGSANLDYVFSAAREIAKYVDSMIVTIKSTVPVGTAASVKKIFIESGKSNIQVISNPEFLREGSAVEDCLKPDRIVVGSDVDECFEKFRELYQPFVRTGNPVMAMDNVSAEMTKYVSNCILATRISFINEMSMLSQKVGADIEKIRQAVGADHRIGSQYLFPSVGFGGSCFPKDVRAMVALFREHEITPNLLEATLHTNELQKQNFCNRIKQYFNEANIILAGKKIAIWGAAFKARTDDIRESPVLAVIDFLIKEKASVYLYDPKANANISEMYGTQIRCVDDPYEAIDQAFGLCVLTEWNQFRHPDFSNMKTKLAHKVIFDGRNLYDSNHLKELGFDYLCIGKA